MSYVTRSTTTFQYEGRRFKFIGFNFYPFNVEVSSLSTIQAILGAAKDRGITVMRTWCFDAGKPPSNVGGNFRYLSGNILRFREAQFVQLDTLLAIARRYGIKIILCLADNTPNYDTKATYVNWANAVYNSRLSTSYPYTGFFDSEDCRTIYKQFIDKLVNRVNTFNGRVYKEDDTIFSWELGNELRYDVFDSEGGSQNTASSTNIAKVRDWANVMSTYIKSVDPNHLVSFGAMEHTWQWVQDDTVSNGSGYGVDYNILSALPNIDYLDIHCYPNQGGTELLSYGQRLGYPTQRRDAGFRAQLRDYVAIAKANGKPAIIGEVGFVAENPGSNLYFPLNPRTRGLIEISNEWFNAGGDGIVIWHASTATESYNLNLNAIGGESLDTNRDDTKMMSYIYQKNYHLNGQRIPVDAVRGITI